MTDIPMGVQWKKQITQLKKSWTQSLMRHLETQIFSSKIKLLWYDGEEDSPSSPKVLVKPTDSCFRLVEQKLKHSKGKLISRDLHSFHRNLMEAVCCGARHS